ncbi:hypothetical protein WJT86_10150 [Microvirga sp. W0021]|uniref:Methyltransferase type 11 domain-containing protein n=1 Tax=Hohaiivirga grylli TaxID=3133970 RepID=A0ABV0BNM2_9HYPH
MAMYKNEMLPPVFDVDFYKQHLPVFSSLNSQELRNHFRESGIYEGLSGSPPASREEFIKIVQKEKSILEIGPFHTPAVVGKNVSYFDVLNQEELIKRALEIGFETKHVPYINYVSKDCSLDIVDQNFSAVFGSHSIEHQPDLIDHLSGVSRILEDEGRYYIICPDKRYCFDHFVRETDLVDVLAAHALGMRVHEPRSPIAQRLYSTHNDANKHWRGEHGEARYKEYPETLQKVLSGVLPDGQYHDCHAWQFTPNSFYEITSFLYNAGFSDLYPERIYHTPYGRVEFTAVLRKRSKNSTIEIEPYISDVNSELNKKGKLEAYYRNLILEKKSLQEEKERLQNEINVIYKSKGWRLTSILRRIRNLQFN